MICKSGHIVVNNTVNIVFCIVFVTIDQCNNQTVALPQVKHNITDYFGVQDKKSYQDLTLFANVHATKAFTTKCN